MNRTRPPKALELMLAVAADPDGPAAPLFDAHFYPLVFRLVRRRQLAAGIAVARRAGHKGSAAPPVSAADTNAAVHDAVVRGLQRSRRSAGRFDRSRATPEEWVIRSALFAYVEVACEYQAAGKAVRLVSLESDEWAAEEPRAHNGHDPAADICAKLDTLDAIDRLPERQRAALLLVDLWGFSYAETAHILFAAPGKTKAVDKLLQQARAQVRKYAADDSGDETFKAGTADAEGEQA